MFLSILSGGKTGEDAVLRSMFEARKRIFVDLLKWDVPVLANRYEIDQFDDPHATYLVLTDSDGQHLGSARLLNTERPHILDSLFANLSNGPIPKGPDVREVTRFCIDPRQVARQRRITRDTLVTALAHHALQNGINHYTGVAEQAWMDQIMAFGWACEPLGASRRHGGCLLGAVQISITANTPALLAAAGIVSRLSPSALETPQAA